MNPPWQQPKPRRMPSSRVSRGGLPLETQPAEAQSFVESTAKRLEAEQRKGEELTALQAELAEEVAEQAVATAAVAAKLATAEADLAAIAAKVSAESGQQGASGDLLRAGTATKLEVADLCNFAVNPGGSAGLGGCRYANQPAVTSGQGT